MADRLPCGADSKNIASLAGVKTMRAMKLHAEV
jgi:hypothetical protein